MNERKKEIIELMLKLDLRVNEYKKIDKMLGNIEEKPSEQELLNIEKSLKIIFYMIFKAI